MSARLIFDKSMGFTVGTGAFKALMQRLMAAMVNETGGGSSTQTRTGITVMLHTGHKSAFIIKKLALKPEKYRVCLICDTLHFRSATIIKDPFECPCGKTINK